MTVRECIKEMRKIPSIFADTIVTYNETSILIPEIKREYHNCYISLIYSKIKYVNEEPIFRIIACYIRSNKNTKGLDMIKKYKYHDQSGISDININRYYIPEKELNKFISINGGIDRYRSIDLNWKFTLKCNKKEKDG